MCLRDCPNSVGIILESSDSMSSGLGRPDASSSSIKSKIGSDSEPNAARMASSDFHLNRS